MRSQPMLTLAGSASNAGGHHLPLGEAPCATQLGGERQLRTGAQLTSVTSRKIVSTSWPRKGH